MKEEDIQRFTILLNSIHNILSSEYPDFSWLTETVANALRFLKNKEFDFF